MSDTSILHTGLGRIRGSDEVAGLQRARVISATLAALEREPFSELTVAKVIARARISRKTFYEQFTDIEDCFLATFEQGIERVRELAISMYRAETSWREGMRLAASAVLEAFDQDRRLAMLCLVHPLSAGERTARRRAEAVRELADAIAAGAQMPASEGELPPLMARALAGAVLALLSERLITEPRRPLAELRGTLMSIVVMPYLGRAQARAELYAAGDGARLPDLRARPGAPAAEPLDGLRFRVTYRTVRVLSVIHEHPRASNRQVAASAGIGDQGQVSKLLKRLAGLGLIVNHGDGPAKGARNEWLLTPLGERVRRATSYGY
jgi:AcrR family transcriptional regulator